MSAAEWKKTFQDEWGLQGLRAPESLDWKCVYEIKPFGRNLLKNPSPHVCVEKKSVGIGKLSSVQKECTSAMAKQSSLFCDTDMEAGVQNACGPNEGLSKDIAPPEPELPEVPMHGPPIFQPEGDYSGWTTNTEVLPYDTSGIPEGAVICALPRYSWFSLEQTVDLKAEGLWEELLDDFQPEIVIQDWYEESQLHQSIYQLHVKLLGADKSTVISEHSVKPIEDRTTYSHTWKEVSHVFSGYGPGVRYIHFLHRLKNQYLNSFFPTMFTGSSVTVKPIKTSS